MPSVRLNFNVPDPDAIWVKLHILEASAKDGVFSEIEEVTALGTKPNWITEYSSNNALSVDDWFAIQWEDDQGVLSEISNPVQGRTSTAVGKIVERVQERNSAISKIIVTQEAESAIYQYLQVDPYSENLDLTYTELRGLTNLTLAMCYIVELSTSGQGASWTAGIVNFKISDAAIKQRADAIKNLIKAANRDLALEFSMVAYLEDIAVAGGIQGVTTIDQSRLLLVELR